MTNITKTDNLVGKFAKWLSNDDFSKNAQLENKRVHGAYLHIYFSNENS